MNLRHNPKAGPLQDRMIVASVMVACGLALLMAIGLLVFGLNHPLPPLPWIVPSFRSFTILSALAIAFICPARYRTLGGPWVALSGPLFLIDALFTLFYVSSWSGLDASQSLLGDIPGAAAVFRILMHLSVVFFLFPALLSPSIRFTKTRLRMWYVVSLLTAMSLGALVIFIQSAYPALLPLTPFSASIRLSMALMVGVLAVGTPAVLWRYWRYKDNFLGYLSLFLLTKAFGILGAALAQQPFDLWWYWSQTMAPLAYIIILFGLLFEGYSLYYKEQSRTRRQSVLSEVAKSMAGATDTESIGTSAVKACAQVMSARATGLYLSENRAGDNPSLWTFGMAPSQLEQLLQSQTGESDFSLIGQIKGKAPPFDKPRILLGAMEEAQEEQPQRQPLTFVAAPVRDHKGQIMGAMLAGFPPKQCPSHDDRELLSALCDLVGLEMENGLLMNQMVEVNERLALASIRAAQSAEEAQSRNMELLAVIDSMGEGVIIANPDGHIVAVNRNGRDLFFSIGERRVVADGIAQTENTAPGTSPPIRSLESVNVDLRNLQGHPIPRKEWPIYRVLQGQSFAQNEVLLIGPDGSQRHLLVTGSPVSDPQGQLLLAVTVWTDISAIRQYEQEREEFISVVAHDLRGALTPIRAYGELLTKKIGKGKDCPDPQLSRAVEAINTSSKRVERLTSDLLDVSRIEAHQLTLKKSAVDPETLVRQIVGRIAGIVEDTPISIEMEGALPQIEADPERVEQVLSNLIDNAAKYSYPASKVTVRLEAYDNEVRFSVTNLGPGIRPKDQKRLFAKFYRTSVAAKGKKTGTGLGLYIAKGLVEAHGGRIWVESKLDQYTTFHFTLPSSTEEQRKISPAG